MKNNFANPPRITQLFFISPHRLFLFHIIFTSSLFCFGKNYTVVIEIIILSTMSTLYKIVGNKAEGRISKRMFQESKARQNLRKTNISFSLIRTRTCAYQEVRNVCFSEILTCFDFLKHPF